MDHIEWQGLNPVGYGQGKSPTHWLYYSSGSKSKILNFLKAMANQMILYFSISLIINIFTVVFLLMQWPLMFCRILVFFLTAWCLSMNAGLVGGALLGVTLGLSEHGLGG